MTGPVNLTVAALTFRQLFTRRRFVASTLFALMPLVIVLVWQATNRKAGLTPAQFLSTTYQGLVAFVLLPLSAVVFGTAAFGGEIDDGTIVYLLVKDLPRWQVVLSKY